MFKGHPKGLIWAALSNMGERFGYYIMNAVLVLFLCSKFGIPDDTAGLIFSVFYFMIYIMALPGGWVADKLQNYKGTIAAGLIVMAVGYTMLSVPTTVGPENKIGMLVLICAALLIITIGNGLFKGNLQAIVGQMYDNMEAEAAKKGPEALAEAQSKRDPGFQIFYVFINLGGVFAPFVAPNIRKAWLAKFDMAYNSDLPALCHQYLNDATGMTDVQMANLNTWMEASNHNFTAGADMAAACESYLEVFNTGVHYSFIASIAAMLLSFVIFLVTKKMYPTPAKKEKKETANYTAEERVAMAKDIKQRMAGLYAVLGIVIFFWFSFHQNTQSLTIFTRNFVNSDQVAPEVWQFLNPFLVIVLTPIIMWLFATPWGRKFSTPKKIAVGMGFAACAYIFLTIFSMFVGYPSGTAFMAQDAATIADQKCGAWVLIVTYFFLTVAELFISPLGLSFVSKIAPKHLQGICQGLWLGATALGNLIIFLGVKMLNSFPSLWMTWITFAIICIIAMSVMFGMLKWLERITAQQQ